MKQKIMMLFLAIIMCYTFTIPIVNVQAAQTLTGNATGTIDGYNYELWKDSGTTSMTLNGGGKFNCSWSNINNALFRIGKKFDSTQTYQQLGNITVNYGCNYQPNGNSYLCVYGWTRSPLVEYYIVDSWGSWRPPGSSSKGAITVDGGTYDVYETTRTNQPSIDGTATFQQYWSVRTSKRTSGTISVTEHFNQWANKGMQLGKMYECALTVEGYQSSGTADVYSNTITIGGSGNPTPTSSTGPTPTPSSGGTTVQCEDMSLSGQYAGQISSPFSGVALYANNDAATTTISFSGNSSITLYGASNNSSTAQVSLYIGSSKVGAFSFTGTSKTASTVNFNASGSQTVKFVVETDTGAWDAYLDYFTVNGGSSGTTPTPTPISGGSTVQCENMSLSGQYAGQISSPFSGVALYANNDAATTTISFSGNSSITLYGASNNSSTAQVSLYIGSSKVGAFSFAGTSKSASTVNFNANGSQTVKFVVETDTGAWDAYLDYFTVNGGSGGPTPTQTGGPVVTPTPGQTGKFHCFLLLGQSNMAGYPRAQAADKVENPRILVLDYDTNQWRIAVPPLHETWQGAIGPGDWFSKTIINKLPADDTIGLIPCAISGERIETFMKSGGSKYNWIIQRSNLAQQRGGVIEGILFHQGESNNGDTSWPGKVRTLVTDLKNDLNLGNIPFIAGELLYSGSCAGHNTLVNQLPSVITNCYVVSANGLVVDPADTQWGLHFGHDSQVTLGKRYAEKMIQALGW